MEFIDNYSVLSTQTFPFANHLLQALMKIPQFITESGFKNSESLQFSCIVQKAQKYQILSSVSLDFNRNMVHFRLVLSENCFHLCKNPFERQIIQRHFLDYNSNINNNLFSISPLNNQITLSQSLLIENIHRSAFLMVDIILLTLQKLSYQLKTQLFKIISKLADSDTCAKSGDISQRLNVYIKSSSHYAWNCINQETAKPKFEGVSNFYNNTKRQFRLLKKMKRKPVNSKASAITSINCRPVDRPFFCALTTNQDEQLRLKYLSRNIPVCKESKQVEKVVLNQKQYRPIQMEREKKIKIKTQNLGTLKVNVRVHSTNEKADNQIRILKLLDSYEFIGIPKHYIVESPQRLILLNLLNKRTIKKYIQNNKTTISLNTKLSFLIQITNTLKYLKQFSIIYNNLVPENIQVKKGIIKIHDFSNSYLLGFSNKKLTLQNKFPYVQVIDKLKAVEDQRTDIFSLGAIMQQIMIGKSPFCINDTKLTLNSELRGLFATKPQLFVPEKSNLSSMKQLQHLFLKCLQNENVGQRTYTGLKNRPHLDWMTILLKSFQQQIYRL